MDKAPPDWQDGDCCFRCRSQFTLVARKHHCRNCGNIFCAKCSSQQIPLPKLNIDKAVRVCDGCYEKFAVKNEDPLLKSGNKDPSDNKSEASVVSKSSSTSSASKSESSNTKSSAKASAPSESELKEEEELQLALALSLSEAPPVSIQFPDCKQLKEPTKASSTSNGPSQYYALPNDMPQQPPLQQQQQPLAPQQEQQYLQQPQYPTQIEQVQSQIPELDSRVIDSDKELMRFVAEVQSTAEVFANRIESNITRNRPVEGDTAIQSLFLKLNNMHAKLSEHIKTHDEERAKYEAIQDKLSQISDARAALDALHEEHQEKIRQEAAEAERLRQSQLASKLEMMRQKKTQMMQYQRDLALQRIQEQEMMLNQQRQAGVIPTTGQQTSSIVALPPPTQTAAPFIVAPTSSLQQVPSIAMPSQQQTAPSMMAAPVQTAPMLVGVPQVVSAVSMPKQDDEAPLISFDD